MFRDLGINKTAFIRIDFREYYDELFNLGETGVFYFNRTLWDENDASGAAYGNCRNLTYVLLRACILLPGERQVEIYDIQNYTIFREDREIEGSQAKMLYYFWDTINVVVKNVPTLPYVRESP